MDRENYLKVVFDVCWHLKSIEWPKSLKRLGEGNPKSRQDV